MERNQMNRKHSFFHRRPEGKSCRISTYCLQFAAVGFVALFLTNHSHQVCAQTTARELNQKRFGSQAPVRDELVKSQMYVKNARQIRNESIVMQQRDFSCGAAALATILNYYWEENVSETALLVLVAKLLTKEELRDRVANGLSLMDLKRVAQAGGYTAIVGKFSIERLGESKLPLIVAITVNEYDHFVVYRGRDENFIYLADPIRGKLRVPVETFVEQWQKNAILAVIKPKTKPNQQSPLLVQPTDRDPAKSNSVFLRTFLTGRVNP
ncbi:MAG TPA: hypothetical protein DEF45_17040 [Rhodopirellula sp.]|nr:hypothetical protein [Rhodopirellula sp.]